MAKRISPKDVPARSVTRNTYNWTELFDGDMWELQQGTEEQVAAGDADFTVSPQNFRLAAGSAAKAQGKFVKVSVRTFVPEDSEDNEPVTRVYVQYLRPLPDEDRERTVQRGEALKAARAAKAKGSPEADETPGPKPRRAKKAVEA